MIEHAQSHIDQLFSPDLISPIAASELPSGYHIRPLQSSDYEVGFLSVLNTPENAKAVSKALFERRFASMKPRDMAGSYVLVVVDNAGKIVGTGTLLLEMKLQALSFGLSEQTFNTSLTMKDLQSLCFGKRRTRRGCGSFGRTSPQRYRIRDHQSAWRDLKTCWLLQDDSGLFGS